MAKYVVEVEGRSIRQYLVTRRSSIGQGRSVMAYGSKETAERVANFLNEHVNDEV
jgi:hypothetical protein